MTAEAFLDGRVTLHVGDCLNVLAAMPENSVDSVVCDPPYHLTSIVKRFGGEGATPTKADGPTGVYKRSAAGFMGKAWDGGDVAFRVETWAAVLRVLKPGGYILAFASTRGFGRMSVAIEDAGFITHPMIGWIFGSGFPKATRIKAEGFEGQRYGGQALKPALEPIYMGQKPFSEETGTANILRWGTGAVNIDACRVGTDESLREGASKLWSHYREGEASAERRYQDAGSTNFAAKPGPRGGSPDGRWPANLLHDGSEDVEAAFPDSDGNSGGVIRCSGADSVARGKFVATERGGYGGGSGSAARFFYAAKADADDRIGSKHPTVKPIDLIQYLCRLITPKGGTILDPFAGTGTTAEAAWREGFDAILIEREAEYAGDIRRRMKMAIAGPEERKRAIAAVKAGRAGTDPDHGPLFGSAA
jgi:site-specific DNA-methyltransferase (adenine-specific)